MEVKFDRLNNLKTEFINSLKSDYQFDGFHHYTDFLNFTIIMKEGELLCRNEAQKCGYFHDAAEQRVIDKTSGYVKNYVRFYYKENTPTIYVNEGIKFDNSMPHIVFSRAICQQNQPFTSQLVAAKNQIFSDISLIPSVQWR